MLFRVRNINTVGHDKATVLLPLCENSDLQCASGGSGKNSTARPGTWVALGSLPILGHSFLMCEKSNQRKGPWSSKLL